MTFSFFIHETNSVERQVKDLEVRDSNPGSGLNFSLQFKLEFKSILYIDRLVGLVVSMSDY